METFEESVQTSLLYPKCQTRYRHSCAPEHCFGYLCRNTWRDLEFSGDRFLGPTPRDSDSVGRVELESLHFHPPGLVLWGCCWATWEECCPGGGAHVVKGCCATYSVAGVTLIVGSGQYQRLMKMKSIRNTLALLLDHGLAPLIICSGVPSHQSSSFLIPSSD